MILFYIKNLSGYVQLWYGIRFNYWTWYFALISANVTASILNYNNESRLGYSIDRLFRCATNTINLYILYNYHIYDKHIIIYLQLITLYIHYKAIVTNKKIYIMLSYTFSALMNSCMISAIAIQCHSIHPYFPPYIHNFLC